MAQSRRTRVLGRLSTQRGPTATTEGFSELYAALKELPRATERNVLKKASKLAMTPMMEVARNYAPVKTGQLRNSIGLRVGIDDPGFRARARASFLAKGHARGVKKTKGGGEVLTQIVAGGNLAPHASLIELGTVRITAHPFLRPAFDQGHAEVVRSVRETIKVEIRKAVQRRARKLAKGTARG